MPFHIPAKQLAENTVDEGKKEDLLALDTKDELYIRYNKFGSWHNAVMESLKDGLSERLLDGCYYEYRTYSALQVSFPAQMNHRVREHIRRDTRGDFSAKDVYMNEMVDVCSMAPGVSVAICLEKLWAEDVAPHCACYSYIFKDNDEDLSELMQPSKKFCYNHLVFDFSSHKLIIMKDVYGHPKNQLQA